jgi:hypothetical protein
MLRKVYGPVTEPVSEPTKNCGNNIQSIIKTDEGGIRWLQEFPPKYW